MAYEIQGAVRHWHIDYFSDPVTENDTKVSPRSINILFHISLVWQSPQGIEPGPVVQETLLLPTVPAFSAQLNVAALDDKLYSQHYADLLHGSAL